MGKKGRAQKTEHRIQKTDVRRHKKKKWRIPFRIPRFLIPKDEPIVPRPFTPIDYGGGILVFFICWAVYLHTLTPTIGFHDSGDMVTAAYVLGIPHPTGYPLYCLLGKLWMTILPMGNIAYRMNMASALCASLACMMVYFIVLKVGGGVGDLVKKRSSEGETSNTPSLLHSFTYSLPLLIPAMVGGLMLAFATTFWEQAVIAEKYTLNALFATLLIFILLKWQETILLIPNHRLPITNYRLPTKYLYLFTFTLGLSFTHHMQTIYLVPASIFFIIAVCWQNRKYSSLIPHLSSLAKMFCLFILPLFLYLYLPIRGNTYPPIMWGEPNTFRGFIDYVSGREYRELYLSLSINEIIKRGYMHITSFFSEQFTWFVVWFGVVGILVFLKKRCSIFFFLVLIILTNSFFTIQYSIKNIDDYYLPVFIVFSIGIGYGIIFIISLVIHKISKILFKKEVIYLVILLFLFIPILPFISHYNKSNKRLDYSGYDYGNIGLKNLRENSFLVIKTDNEFIMWYLHYVEKQRNDVKFIEGFTLHCKWYLRELKRKYPDLIFDTFIPTKKDMSIEELGKIRGNKYVNIVLNNFKRCPIYIPYDEEIGGKCTLIPEGLYFRVIEKDISNEKLLTELEQINIEFISRLSPCLLEVEKNLYFSVGVLYGSIGMYEKASIMLEKALNINPNYSDAWKSLIDIYYNIGVERKNLDEAIKYYKKVIKIDPEYIKARRNLGSLYYKKGMIDLAIKEFEKIVEIDPLYILAHKNLATIYYNKGDFKKSLIHCNYILEVDTNNTYAKQMREEIRKKGG